jgi:hypothetical protein
MIPVVSPLNAILLVALGSCLLALLALRRGAARTRSELRSLLATTSELRHLADHDPLTFSPRDAARLISPRSPSRRRPARAAGRA